MVALFTVKVHIFFLFLHVFQFYLYLWWFVCLSTLYYLKCKYFPIHQSLYPDTLSHAPPINMCRCTKYNKDVCSCDSFLEDLLASSRKSWHAKLQLIFMCTIKHPNFAKTMFSPVEYCFLLNAKKNVNLKKIALKIFSENNGLTLPGLSLMDTFITLYTICNASPFSRGCVISPKSDLNYCYYWVLARP